MLPSLSTLTAWSDSEFAKGTFGTQNFGIEASKTSATAGFSDHATEDQALVLTADYSATDAASTDITWSFTAEATQ